jgi:hypothetical protein
MMNFLKNDFSKAIKGDRVFSFRFGSGVIAERGLDVDGNEDKTTYLICRFKDGNMVPYNRYGFRVKNHYAFGEYPDLYWSTPEFEIPAPPKQMVKREIKVWATIKRNNEVGYLTTNEIEAKQWCGMGYRVEELTKVIEIEE